MPGVGQAAADSLQADLPGLNIVGIDAPDLGFEKATDTEQAVLDRIRTAKPDIVLVALGCPKQELLMHRWRDVLAPSVMLGIGATLDFIAGNVSRAPAWMSQAGAEWIYRIIQDPSRMMKRYLVRDRAIWPIALRMLRMPKAERAFGGDEGR
jgi:N-acetylglucosaminyldiphosphoundecaprenol N-acetyl-beta-D-mannosaminyltransferase